MATQPIQRNEQERCQPAESPKDGTGRILAEEAAQEKDPEKLMKIIEALTQALDDARKNAA